MKRYAIFTARKARWKFWGADQCGRWGKSKWHGSDLVERASLIDNVIDKDSSHTSSQQSRVGGYIWMSDRVQTVRFLPCRWPRDGDSCRAKLSRSPNNHLSNNRLSKVEPEKWRGHLFRRQGGSCSIKLVWLVRENWTAVGNAEEKRRFQAF